jgi:hypothetical protein
MASEMDTLISSISSISNPILLATPEAVSRTTLTYSGLRRGQGQIPYPMASFQLLHNENFIKPGDPEQLFYIGSGIS